MTEEKNSRVNYLDEKVLKELAHEIASVLFRRNVVVEGSQRIRERPLHVLQITKAPSWPNSYVSKSCLSACPTTCSSIVSQRKDAK